MGLLTGLFVEGELSPVGEETVLEVVAAASSPEAPASSFGVVAVESLVSIGGVVACDACDGDESELAPAAGAPPPTSAFPELGTALQT